MTDVPDERTTPVRRDAASDAGVPNDAEATAVSARRPPEGGTATEPAGPDGTDPPGPRRTGGAATGTAGLDLDEGSTIVARRESRRRASRAVDAEVIAHDGDAATVVVAADGRRRLPSTLAGDVPAQLGRVARPPASSGAAYPPRPPQQVVAPRAAPPVRAPQETVDTAATEQAARRNARRRAVGILLVAAVIVLVATTAIVILSTL